MSPYAAVDPEMTAARESYALTKYGAMTPEERTGVDRWIEALHQHYRARAFHPEPSFVYKLGLLMALGTFLNENAREK
jgi:hypothetical protein